MSRRFSAVLVALLLGLSLAGPVGPSDPATATVAAERKVAKPQKAGRYVGTTYDEGRAVRREYVRFRVTKNRKRIKGFTARIGMYCYVGPPTYTMILPTAFKAPAMKIRNGRVNRGWSQVFSVDGEPHVLTGPLVLRFKKNGRARGTFAVDFASCGTTTGSPAGYIPFRVRHRR